MELGLRAPEISLLNFYPPYVWDQPVPCLHTLSTSLDGCGFFNSIVVKTSNQHDSDGSE